MNARPATCFAYDAGYCLRKPELVARLREATVTAATEAIMILAICALLALAGLFGASVNALAGPIRIESGTYGENCGAHHGNSTRELALRCNALDTCRYPVGSSAVFRRRNACKADFVAEWSCAPGELHRAAVRSAANDGGILVLTCIPSTGAGK